jgi:hypothetical protein
LPKAIATVIAIATMNAPAALDPTNPLHVVYGSLRIAADPGERPAIRDAARLTASEYTMRAGREVLLRRPGMLARLGRLATRLASRAK